MRLKNIVYTMKRITSSSQNSDFFLRPRFQPFQINNPQQSFINPGFNPTFSIPPPVSAFVRYKQLRANARQTTQKTSKNIQQDRGTLARKSSTGSKVQIKRTRSKSHESEVRRTKEPKDYPTNSTRNSSEKIIHTKVSGEDRSTSPANFHDRKPIKQSNIYFISDILFIHFFINFNL